ncbi:MAG: MFS transporter [Alphaproteobacteria bacterium]|nr:MFS transporter [Alphaproteobacteria bacterium]
MGSTNSKQSLLAYLCIGGLLSGIVLIGITSTFALMLSEKGVSIKTITNILLATLPYSWRFIISPSIKNILIKMESKKLNGVRVISFISQSILSIGFACLGMFDNNNYLLLSGLLILLIVIASTSHEVVRSHIKLCLFKKEDLGIVTSVENTGFRIGMFLAGACIIYLSNVVGWKESFMIFGFGMLAISMTTFVLNVGKTCEKLQIQSTKKCLKFCLNFFNKKNLFFLSFLLIAFKFSDSSTVSLKALLMKDLSVGKTEFANISYLIGLFVMILSGVLAGWLSKKIGTKNCIYSSVIGHILVAIVFLYMVTFKPNIITIAILISISTFIFGFSGVVFRTYIAEISEKDVNMYTILMSIGSAIRISSYSLAGLIVEKYSWCTVYMICIISNIPAIIAFNKRKSW